VYRKIFKKHIDDPVPDNVIMVFYYLGIISPVLGIILYRFGKYH